MPLLNIFSHHSTTFSKFSYSRTHILQIVIKFIEMAKQNIVVKVAMINGKKTRKALKIAVGVSGVKSVALIGSDKDQIKVTGEGIDSVELVMLLRKGVGCTELVSLGPVAVEEKKPAITTPAASQKLVTGVPLQVYPHHYSSYGGSYYHVYESSRNDDPSCTIM